MQENEIVSGFNQIIKEGMDNKLNKIELIVPYEKFLELFGASYSYLQQTVAPLCNRYGLSASIRGWETTGKDTVLLILERDFDNPKYQEYVEQNEKKRL